MGRHPRARQPWQWLPQGPVGASEQGNCVSIIACAGLVHLHGALICRNRKRVGVSFLSRHVSLYVLLSAAPSGHQLSMQQAVYCF